MTTLTIRLPEDKHERLKALAQARKISVNKLVDELATVALANHDAFLRYQGYARQGDPQRALALLEGLDRADQVSDEGEDTSARERRGSGLDK